MPYAALFKNSQLFRLQECFAAQQKEIRQLEKALAERDEEIQRLKQEAHGVEVLDVDAGVMRLEVREDAEPPAKRLCREQAATAVQHARVSEMYEACLIKVKQEKAEVQEELLEERDERGFQIRVAASTSLSRRRHLSAEPYPALVAMSGPVCGPWSHICAFGRRPTLSKPR